MTPKPKIRFVNRPLGDLDTDTTIGPDVEDRVQAKSVIEMLYNLEAEIALDGWDQPHQLGLVYKRGRARAAGQEVLYLEYVSIPTFWRAANRAERVHYVLVDLADSLREAMALEEVAAPENLFAVVIITEAWALLKGKLNEQDEQAAQDRKLHEHPDRVEVRVLNAVDVEGASYFLQHERDGIVQHTATKTSIGGDVIDGMRYFMDISLGRETPAWIDFPRRKDPFPSGSSGA